MKRCLATLCACWVLISVAQAATVAKKDEAKRLLAEISAMDVDGADYLAVKRLFDAYAPGWKAEDTECNPQRCTFGYSVRNHSYPEGQKVRSTSLGVSVSVLRNRVEYAAIHIVVHTTDGRGDFMVAVIMNPVSTQDEPFRVYYAPKGKLPPLSIRADLTSAATHLQREMAFDLNLDCVFGDSRCLDVNAVAPGLSEFLTNRSVKKIKKTRATEHR